MNFDLTDVRFVHRIVVGSQNGDSLPSEDEAQSAITLLNRCLTVAPKGRILGIEKTAKVLNIGEQQLVIETLAYHIGFPRKPAWLD